MLFFQGLFFVFLLAVVIATAAARTVRARTWVLLGASYAFYAAWDWRFCALILGSTAIDHYVAARMPGASRGTKRRLLVTSLVVNLGSLAVFKYLDFGIASLRALFGVDIPLAELTLPVGISFFTFQSMSYTIDVYRGELEPTEDFVDFALFVSFFPQLVAGPIIRAADFLPQIRQALSRPLRRLAEAAPLFVFGLFKKVVVADQLGLIVDEVYSDPAAFSSGDRWMATLAFAGQIYGDFSGYTDMALAVCILMGFEFPLNFRSPYLSLGPQEFWRRWHISLSTWLRDYLYIPLGGSRRGVARMYAALFTTMLLGGLWHGAAWTFVLWGAFHGSLLVVERVAIPKRLRTSWWTVPVRWPIFFALTLVGWMIFRAESWESLMALMEGLWRWQPATQVPMGVVAAAMAYVALDHVLGEWAHKGGWIKDQHTLRFAAAGVLLALSFLLRPSQSTAFIYFQF